MSSIDHEYDEQALQRRKLQQRSNCVAAILDVLKKWFPRSKDYRMFLVHRDFVLRMTLDGALNVVEHEFQFDTHTFSRVREEKPMGGIVGESIRKKHAIL